jgi:hypothetical protein
MPDAGREVLAPRSKMNWSAIWAGVRPTMMIRLFGAGRAASINTRDALADTRPDRPDGTGDGDQSTK